MWIPGPGEVLGFAELAPPTDEDVAELTFKVARRLTKVARRYLAEREAEFTVSYSHTADALICACRTLAIRLKA